MRSFRSIAYPSERSLSALRAFGRYIRSKGSDFDFTVRVVIVGFLLGPIAIGILFSANTSSSTQSQSPAYGFIGPELAAQGESFTGIVVEHTNKGDVPLKAGEQVNVGGQNLTVGPGGVITCPGFPGLGNFFLRILINLLTQTSQTQPNISHHVEVIKVPPNAPTRIARTPNIVTPGARFNVEGQGLNALEK